MSAISPMLARRLLLNQALLANETTSPNAGSGTVADRGSLWMRAGGGANSETGLYMKMNTTDKGWLRQNLVNLQVFNVQNYGAVADGTTDCGPFFATTIAAAIANGGGVIYVPGVNVGAGKQYKFIKPGANLGSIFLRNVTVPLWFLGDGYASKMSMIGSAAAGDWHLIRVDGSSSRMRFSHLHLDGSGITNPDPGDQNHFISLEGIAADNVGPSDIEIDHMWFGPINGDMVRPIASFPATISNVRIHHCAQDSDHCRSFVEGQRGTQRFQVYYNRVFGADDNDIDFEPTGGVNDVSPKEWQVRGNIIDHQSRNTDSITMTGIGANQPTLHCIWAHNIIMNGGQMTGLNIQDCAVIGNVVTVNNAIADPIVDLFRVVQGCTIDYNCLISQTAVAGRQAVKLDTNSGSNPIRNRIGYNMLRSNEANGILLECTDFQCDGNIIVPTTVSAGDASGIRATAIAADIDHGACVGNLILAGGANLGPAINYHAQGGFSLRNTIANHNFMHGCSNGVVWDRATTETLLDWRGGFGNNVVNGTSGTIGAVPVTTGLTIEGNAGPGCQIGWILLTAGPEGNVTAPVGSLCTNAGGGQNNVIYYKETGVGVSGGSSGWARNGATPVIMGARSLVASSASLFLAPGVGLAAASATEIQWVATRAATIRNLRINCIAGVGAANVTITIRKGGVATTVTATMLNTATSASDVTHSFTVVAGDKISILVTKDAVPGTPQTNFVATFDFSG